MLNENKDAECYSLSASQRNIWRLEQAFPGISVNNICETIRINGIFDVVLLQKCLNLVVEGDRSLRIQFKLNEDALPVQYEAAYEKQHFAVLDFSATNSDGLKRWEESITREVMPLLNMPLFYFAIIKINEHEGGVFVKTHHLISDGWSQISLINRIASVYLSLVSGEKAECEALPSYRTHVEQEMQYRGSKAFARDVSYWRQTLKDMPQCVSMKECRTNELSPVGHRKTYEFTEIMNHEFMNYCTKYRIAPMLVLYMAVGIFLERTQGIKKFCMGTPVHNRSNVTARNTTGMFVSTLPFLSELDGQMTFSQYTRYLADEWMELLRHQRLSFTDIMEVCRRENPDADRLYHMVINFHSSRAYQSGDTLVTFSGQWHYAGYQAEHLCIHLNNIMDKKRFSVSYDFLTQLFSENEIDHMHHYLMNILMQVLIHPDKPLCELMFLSNQEKERVLFGFNDTEKPYFEGNLSDMLHRVYRRYAKRVAVIQDGIRYTYEMLKNKAELIAEQIDQAVDYPAAVAVMLPRSFALYAAMAGIVRSGRAWIILSESMPPARRSEILSDSAAAAVITDQKYGYQIDTDVQLIDIGGLMNTGKTAAGRCENKSVPSDTAYLVYTSGSTGKPKGVEIEQRSIINFAEAMKDCFGTGAVLSLCNITFDAFMIESIVSMLNGRTVVLPTEDEGENPAKLAALIENYAVGFVSATPSRIGAYLRDDSFTRAAGRLEYILCGGEAFPVSLLNKIARCSNARVINQYGPSEATVGVSMGCLNDAPVISAGRPMQNCRLYVLDKNRMPLPIGVFGELYIGGECVAKGYKNAPELTQKAFMPSPFESGERLYRTGDIAAWTKEGEILLRGRNDGQVKLRGQRIELNEVALTLMNHPCIRKAAAVLQKEEDSEYLSAYYEADGALSESELMDYSASYMPGYMIPSVFIHMDQIPLTPNGKVDYKKLPKPEPMAALAAENGGNETAQRILELFKEVLHKPDMSVSDDYFRFGGDSLNALDTLAKIEGEFGVRLRVSDIYAYRNALRIAGRMSDHGSTSHGKIEKAPAMALYPVTKAQFGMYYETLRSPEGCTYNMPCGFKTESPIGFKKLEKAADELVRSETVLRLSFVSENGGVYQKINGNTAIKAERFSGMPLSQAAKQFVRPFDLSRAPLMRLGVHEDRDGTTTVLMDLHHIIGDAATAAMLIDRLGRLYGGESITPGKTDYIDYACWRVKNSESIESSQLEYWRGQMKNAPVLPDYPTDRMRTPQFDYKGGQCVLKMGERESSQLKAFARQQDLTVNMIFAGAFGVFLSKLSGSEEFFIGTPVSNRSDPSLKEVLGLFVNTLPLRLNPGRERTFAQYLQETKERVIGLLDNPDIPLEKLVELAKEDGHDGRLYNAILSMRPVVTDHAVFGGLTVKQAEVPSGSAKTELNLEVFYEDGSYVLRLEYASTLFDRLNAEMFERSILSVILDILADAHMKIGDCQAISPADRFRLTDRPHALRIPFVDLPIDRQIDMICALHPEDRAVMFHDETMTFGALKQSADRLASKLIGEGVKRGDHVGVLCRRGFELITALIAVLKAGAAYVPMLPSYPDNRIRYMSEISGAQLLLCDDETLKEKTGSVGGRLISVSQAMEDDGAEPFEPVPARNGEDTCFVLFTSGSTGNPKGVMIRHRSISNLFENIKNNYSVPGGFLCLTNFVFDIFTAETLIPLALGKPVILSDEEELLLPWKTAELFQKNEVGMIQFTPTRAQVFMQNKAFVEAVQNIPVVMTAGEALPQELLDRFREAHCQRILNLYGPTEATVYVSYDDVTHGDKITIGKIYPNSRGYILDEKLRPVMPGARGEFYFAGECLTKGYIGREDLTAEVYLPDPFFKGEKMYKSGDIVRQLADGRVDYCGRSDHQIKLNGQRIELGEINSRMLSSKRVSQAATVVVKENGIMLLYAFVVPLTNENGKNSNETEELREYLKRELPVHMVPSVIQALPQLPKTASGKTDLKELERIAGEMRKNGSAPEIAAAEIPEPTEKEPKTEEPAQIKETVCHEEPVKKQEPNPAENTPLSAEDIKQIWRKVLSRSDVPENLSFFDLGGTSFGALTLLSEYFNRNIRISLADLYANPTLKAQKKLLGITDQPPESAKVTADTSEIPVQIPENRNAVFITGATGFFGAHTVRELIESGVPKVYCLVRGDTERLYDTLAWYFGSGWLAACKNRICAVQGNLLEPDLAIGDELKNTLLGEIGTILHSAADVRHYSADDMPIRVNVDGTRHITQLAKDFRAKLIYVSTVSICAEYIVSEPDRRYEFSEKDYDLGQNCQDNIYLRGKFSAEGIVRAAQKDGLPVIILRLGRLVGRSTDGVFQKNAEDNAFWGLVQGMSCLERIASEIYHMNMEMTAVDECARAAVKLMNEKSGSVFHIFNPHMLPVSEILRDLNIPAKETDRLSFESHIRRKAAEGLGAKIALLLSEYERFMLVPQNAVPVCEITRKRLNELGFEWDRPKPSCLLKMFVM